MAISNELRYFENGEVANAEDVLSNTSFILSQQIISYLNYLKEHSSFNYTPANFIYNLNLNSGIDTTNTTAFKFGDYYICSSTGTEEEVLIDDFEDGTIASFWSFFNSSYWSESGGSLTGNLGSTGTKSSRIYYNGGGLGITGKTLIIQFDFSSNYPDNYIKFYITPLGNSNPSSGICIKTYTNSSGNNYKLKIQPNSSNPDTSVDVYENTGSGYSLVGTFDVSSLGLKLGFLIELYQDGYGDNTRVSLKNVWIDNYQSSVLVTNNLSLNLSSNKFISKIGYHSYSNIDITKTEYSFDNGTTYNTTSDGVIYKSSTSSNQIKIKWTLGYDNTTATNMKTSVISAYGLFYD